MSLSTMKALTMFPLLLATVLDLASAEDSEPWEVKYKSETFTSSLGSSVKLTCHLDYDPAQCGPVHAAWFHQEPKFELTDPSKYFTVVSETVTGDSWRRRQVLTEILDLRAEDEGRYRCQAEAELQTMDIKGHFITVAVRD